MENEGKSASVCPSEQFASPFSEDPEGSWLDWYSRRVLGSVCVSGREGECFYEDENCLKNKYGVSLREIESDESRDAASSDEDDASEWDNYSTQ